MCIDDVATLVTYCFVVSKAICSKFLLHFFGNTMLRKEKSGWTIFLWKKKIFIFKIFLIFWVRTSHLTLLNIFWLQNFLFHFGSLETFWNIFPEYILSEFDNKSKFTQTQGFEQKMKISSVDTIFWSLNKNMLCSL